MRSLFSFSIAFALTIGSVSRADINLEAPAITTGFDAGWSFDGGTISLVDGFVGIIDTSNIGTVVTDYSLTFTSPRSTYELSPPDGELYLLPGDEMRFDGVELALLPTAVNDRNVLRIDDRPGGAAALEWVGPTTLDMQDGFLALIDITLIQLVSTSHSGVVDPLVIATVPEPSACSFFALLSVVALELRRLQRSSSPRKGT